MGLAETKRKLVPTFKFMEKILAWRCDQCDKRLFLNRIQEAAPETIAPHIIAEFLAHSCAKRRQGPPARPPMDGYDGKVVLIDLNPPLPDEHRECE